MLAPVAPNATRTVRTLARFVLLEARRTKLPLVIVCAVVAGVGLAGFLSQLALTESASLQASVVAAFFRVTAVFVTSAFVITSMVRESNEKGTELLLSLPISRSAYYMGKLAGFAGCGGLVAVIFSLVMLAWGTPLGVAAWCISLMLEALLVASVSLFFVVTLGDVVPALAATAGTYVLGRTVAAIQAVSGSPLVDDASSLHMIASWTIDAVALLLPPLDRATQTAWIVYAPPSLGEFADIAAGLCVYCALVVAGGLFDFHRRNL